MFTWTIAGVDSMLVGHSSYLLIGFIYFFDRYISDVMRAGLFIIRTLKDLSPKNNMASLR